ncbi:MAG: hypothetical protein ACOYMN_02380, partial [Roseimicrobium sp.]
ANLNFGAVRDGTWHVPLITMDSLQVSMHPPSTPGSSEVIDDETGGPELPAWLKGWVPSRTQIDEVQVHAFNLAPAAGVPGVTADSIKLNAKPAADIGAWLLRGEGGTVQLPAMNEAFRLTRTAARVSPRALVFHEAVARWYGDSEVTARGDVPFETGKTWSFAGSIANLDLRHLLSADWNAILSGIIEADYEASAAIIKAKVKVKSGIVQNMPVLNRVADFTRAERFRRVVLDEASATVERVGKTTKVSQLLLHSSGLIRVEGGFTIEGRRLSGEFLVGVSPETLRWIPGSQRHVFTDTRSEAPGFVWTTCTSRATSTPLAKT